MRLNALCMIANGPKTEKVCRSSWIFRFFFSKSFVFSFFPHVFRFLLSPTPPAVSNSDSLAQQGESVPLMTSEACFNNDTEKKKRKGRSKKRFKDCGLDNETTRFWYPMNPSVLFCRFDLFYLVCKCGAKKLCISSIRRRLAWKIKDIKNMKKKQYIETYIKSLKSHTLCSSTPYTESMKTKNAIQL